MSRSEVFNTWNRNSRLYQRYSENAEELLSDDSDFKKARDEWEQFFITSHGEIFEQVNLKNSERRIFVDSLYYDFIVDQIIEFAEREFGFKLLNQEPHANTDALSFDFQELHEKVIDFEAIANNLSDHITPTHIRDADVDFLRDLYEGIISHQIRLSLGEYYTPTGVAELGVNELQTENLAGDTFLDPGCGSGVFVSTCINKKTEALAEREPADVLERITNTVYGIDLNPVAVKSTKLSYILSLLPILERAENPEIEVPVFLTDSLRLTREDDITYDGESFDIEVDHLVGNPPWITWNNLSESVKDAWRDTYVEKLDLLAHSGPDSRLGFGNDDISIPFVWVCIHHYLGDGGDASFVMKRDIMKGPAGKLLRTQAVNGREIPVRNIHDFNKLRPFGDDVGVTSAIYTMEADGEPEFPISATSWTKGRSKPEYASLELMELTLNKEDTKIVPVHEDDTSSSWIRGDAERRALGDCAHDIRHGVKDDATDVYTIERDQLDDLEPEFVYPYIKSKHIVKYGLFGNELHLVPIRSANEDNRDELQNRYPKTYSYLENHRDRLEDRASSWLKQGTFYNVFGLGDYTWSDYKVVWCRLGFKPHFAVVSTVKDEDLGDKMVVPGDHFMFISTNNKQEAHFLCALLNSSIYQKSIRGVASEGKASLSKTVISKLKLPEYKETAESKKLAELSMQAHGIVPEYTDVSKREFNKQTIEELKVVQAEIDEVVEELLAQGNIFPGAGQQTLTSF